jgi:hypothetical protein
LVFLQRADPLLAWHILRDGNPLIGNPGDLENRRRYAWRLYVEYRPFFELEAAAVEAALLRRLDGGRGRLLRRIGAAPPVRPFGTCPRSEHINECRYVPRRHPLATRQASARGAWQQASAGGASCVNLKQASSPPGRSVPGATPAPRASPERTDQTR